MVQVDMVADDNRHIAADTAGAAVDMEAADMAERLRDANGDDGTYSGNHVSIRGLEELDNLDGV